jgi:3-phenylpropionate/cinnamic acid dioxygenase small subunit
VSTALAPGAVAATDAAQILDVLARYAQAIDNRDWDDLASVFTPHFSFGSGPSAAVGYDALRAAIESVSPYHPHYSSNTVLHRLDDGRVKAWTKFLLVRTDGSTASGDYIDVVVPTTDGWRIAVREFSRGNRLPTDPGGASVRTFTSAKWRSVPR